jgi:hypothetical protein
MSDWDNFNAVFWTGIATLTFTFFGLALKSCLKSKCDDVSFCNGLLHIHRRVELENNSDDEEKSDDSKNNRK